VPLLPNGALLVPLLPNGALLVAPDVPKLSPPLLDPDVPGMPP
jgi:hypothetical protein